MMMLDWILNTTLSEERFPLMGPTLLFNHYDNPI